MRWAQVTDTGLVRNLNEDSLCISPGIGLFAVADGMGGHLAGEVASTAALQMLEHELVKLHGKGGKPGDVLVGAVKEVNKSIFDMSRKNPAWVGMGTTITACLKSGDELYIAQVGDSRAYLLRGNEIVQLTEDHSLVQQLVKNGGITKEQAIAHPRRNVLTRALGTGPVLEVDRYSVKIYPGDMILLCTDGLTGYLRQEEINAAVRNAPSLDTAVLTLLDQALQRGGADNITAVLVEF